MFKWFSLLGDASTFTNQLEPVRKKLSATAGDSDITEDMYPEGDFLDDTKVQKHNNIPWKLRDDGSSSDDVDGQYIIHKPSNST